MGNGGKAPPFFISALDVGEYLAVVYVAYVSKIGTKQDCGRAVVSCLGRNGVVRLGNS
jgi:hypothetical protein